MGRARGTPETKENLTEGSETGRAFGKPDRKETNNDDKLDASAEFHYT
jgi:hypothetical protein